MSSRCPKAGPACTRLCAQAAELTWVGHPLDAESQPTQGRLAMCKYQGVKLPVWLAFSGAWCTAMTTPCQACNLELLYTQSYVCVSFLSMLTYASYIAALHMLHDASEQLMQCANPHAGKLSLSA